MAATSQVVFAYTTIGRGIGLTLVTVLPTRPTNNDQPPKIIPSNTQMRFRKLRITWSVVWGVVAVLLIALWAMR
jgi:hypothetical protein